MLTLPVRSFYTSRSQAECMSQCQFVPRIKMPVKLVSATLLPLSPLVDCARAQTGHFSIVIH